MAKHHSTHQQHNRKVQFMRYILRRKQCAVLALIEVAVLVMLAAFCIGAYFGYQIFNDKRIEIDTENAVIDRYGDNITFAHCKFIEVSDFNTHFCKNRIGVIAFAYRYHALENENDKTCLDINEQVYCHEYINANFNSSVSNPLPQSSSYQNRCPGFSNASLADNHTIEHDRIVPLDLDDSTALKNLIKDNKTIVLVHVQQLFIKCPKCEAGDISDEKVGQSCKRKISTAEKGWPWFAESCKEGELTDCGKKSMVLATPSNSTNIATTTSLSSTTTENEEGSTTINPDMNGQRYKKSVMKGDF